MEDENRFELAGWSAIAAAALLPLGFLLAGIEDVAREFGVIEHQAGVGAGDVVLLIFGGISIFVYISLRRMMYERYSFRKLDFILLLAVIWSAVNYGGSFALELLFSMMLPVAADTAGLVSTVFWIVCIGVFGIIDSILGIVLIMNQKRFGMPVRIFAFLTLAGGLCELSIILSFLAIVLFPLAFIALGVAFLKPDEALEFV